MSAPRIKSIIISIIQLFFPDRDFISLLRWELKLFLVHLYGSLCPLEWLKVRRWNRHHDLKVILGSGPLEHPGWINIDVSIRWSGFHLARDLRRPLPFRNGCVKYMFSEHVFEHLSFPEVIESVLKECRRVLQPGGMIRIIVPNAERYLRAYVAEDRKFLDMEKGGIASLVIKVNEVFHYRGFHKFAYDYETMSKLLLKVGFKNVRLSGFRAGAVPELQLDFDDEARRDLSVYIEAET